MKLDYGENVWCETLEIEDEIGAKMLVCDSTLEEWRSNLETTLTEQKKCRWLWLQSCIKKNCHVEINNLNQRDFLSEILLEKWLIIE